MKNELKYSKILKTAGLSREQAESHLKVIEGAMLDNLATKTDLETIKFDVISIRSELKSLEYKLINKIGMMITTATAVLSGVAALLKFAF